MINLAPAGQVKPNPLASGQVISHKKPVKNPLRELAFSRIVPGRPRLKIDWEKVSNTLRELRGQVVNIATPDGAKIEGAFIRGSNPKKVILFVGGNNELWQCYLRKRASEFKSTGASLLFINPRGVGNSKGVRNRQGYALDVYAAAKHLIKEEGIDPENILFAGFSMGGANSARGAALIQQEYPEKKISALNINSYSALQRVLRYRAGIFGYLFSKLLRLNKDAKKAWDSLRGRKVILHNPNDPIIPFSAQLATAVSKNPVGETYIAILCSERTHRIFDTKKSSKKITDAARFLLSKPAWWWPFSPRLGIKHLVAT